MEIKKSQKPSNTITYEVLEECGTISTRKNSEVKLRYMSWNGGDPVYDIRPWKTNPDGTETCLKGITLSGEELESLIRIVTN